MSLYCNGTPHPGLCCVSGDPGCGGTFTESEGIIISPNWPNNYAHNRQCIYLIRLPAGEKVSVNFTHMNLENHSNCAFDYVEVGLVYDSQTCVLMMMIMNTATPSLTKLNVLYTTNLLLKQCFLGYVHWQCFSH